MARACISIEQLLVDPLRRAPERELTERREVGGREEMLQRPFGLLRNVDLALLQALDQVVRGEIDKLDRVGAIENRVGKRLPHTDAGDLGHDIVQALDVLDVKGRIDVDTPGQELLDIEVALGMTAAGNIGVGQLIDEGKPGTAQRAARRGPSPRASDPYNR